MSSPAMEESDETLCFRVGKILLVPHFGKPGIYVGPGYPKETKKEYSASLLLQSGAKRITEHLWPRPKF